MKGKHIVIGRAAIFIFSVALLFILGGSCTRLARGTEPAAALTDLHNLEPLKQAFQRDRGMVRLVALLSPV